MRNSSRFTSSKKPEEHRDARTLATLKNAKT